MMRMMMRMRMRRRMIHDSEPMGSGLHEMQMDIQTVAKMNTSSNLRETLGISDTYLYMT